jgi:hypothetical protein
MTRPPHGLLLATMLRLALGLLAGALPNTYSIVGEKPTMADATRTLPAQGHDDPSSPPKTNFLSCYLDYQTGGALLPSRIGAVLKSAEGHFERHWSSTTNGYAREGIAMSFCSR